MGKFTSIIVCCILSFGLKAQILLNGSFVAGTTFWGCSPETNAETVYGGSNGLNAVAEVDAAAGLCQTVVGLTIGTVYRLSYDCSRRVGGCPSPNPTNISITVSGGALSKTDTRTNSSFALTTSAFIFTATATSHAITFAAGSGFGGSTCGMIMDNIAVAFSPLPIELLYFNVGILDEESVLANWETATELNNDFFTVERSLNSLDWENIGTIKGGGTTNQRLKYNYTDHKPYSGISYYRLKQTDFNGAFKYSSIQSIELEKQQAFSISPNPSKDHLLKISSGKNGTYTINVYDNMGRVLFSVFNHTTSELNLESIEAGIYYLVVSENDKVIYRNRIVLQ